MRFSLLLPAPISNLISGLFNRLLHVLPLRCQLCHLKLDQQHYPWCNICYQHLPSSPRCQHCGLPTSYSMANCGRCQRKPPLWDNLICVADYTFPFDKLIHQFKYQGHYWLAPPLAKLLTEHINQPAPMLLPVPMHWLRRLFRGSNHANLLAQALAKQLNVTCCTNALKRIRPTRQQQGLTRQSRLSNLKNAFAITADLPEHVALVDDVVTTGATLSQLCRLLRQHGVTRIEVYCIVRSTGSPK